MLKDLSLDLLNYHLWANSRLLSHIERVSDNIFTQQIDNVFPSIAETFFHIYQVDQLWLKRCNPELVINERISEFQDSSSALTAFSRLSLVMLQDVQQHFNDYGEITYQNSTGTRFKNTIEEIIRHIVNHGTYHRGNIAAMIRQQEKSGISTDYIQYLRTRDGHLKLNNI